MNLIYISDKTFDKLDYTGKGLETGEYEQCTFVNCNFSNSKLSNIRFVDCSFLNCNMSNAITSKTAFRDVKFSGCKMMGLHFDNCSEFGFSIAADNCALHHSSFYKRILKKTIFNNCKLIEVDFTECDLSGAIFQDCDLEGAIFFDTILEKADLSTAFNYSIDPAHNRIKKAIFSFPAVTGLLDKYDVEIRG